MSDNVFAQEQRTTPDVVLDRIGELSGDLFQQQAELKMRLSAVLRPEGKDGNNATVVADDAGFSPLVQRLLTVESALLALKYNCSVLAERIEL